MGARWNRLAETILTGARDLCFWAEIEKIIYTPVNPCFAG